MPVGLSPIAFDPQHTAPVQLDETQIKEVIQAFVAAAKRALEAGFSVVEVHAAHGYLLHQFLSPLSNQRRDQYGGSFENRIRLVLEVTEAVRGVWPQELPLFVRVRHRLGGRRLELLTKPSNWHDASRHWAWTWIDVSSGGTAANAEIPVGPGYQTRFAERGARRPALPPVRWA